MAHNKNKGSIRKKGRVAWSYVLWLYRGKTGRKPCWEQAMTEYLEPHTHAQEFMQSNVMIKGKDFAVKDWEIKPWLVHLLAL